MRLRRLLRSKVKVTLLTLMIVYICVQVFYSTEIFPFRQGGDSPVHNKQHPKSIQRQTTAGLHKPWRKSNIIINSYMRAGSSFIGRLLGYHPDSFYIYEPLWKHSIWEYFTTDGEICDSKTCNCRRKSITSRMVDHLRAMVECKGLEQVVVAKMTPFYSGIPWMNFTACIKEDPKRKLKSEIANSDRIPAACLRKMQLECLSQRHVVSKVLRLTVGAYEDLLNKTEDTKVIHLFRDPRATINSRLKTKWFPVNSNKDVVLNAKCLCERMLADYDAGLRLQSLYPDRFKMVVYEDLVSDLNVKTNKLYKFAGIRNIDSIGVEIFESIANFGLQSDHALRDNSTDYSSWWRRSFDWDMLQRIDAVCDEVYTKLGYSRFGNEIVLRDMTLSSFKTTPELFL